MIRFGPVGSRLSTRAHHQAAMRGGRGVVSSRFPSWDTVRRRLVKNRFQDEDHFSYERDIYKNVGVSEAETTRLAWERFEYLWGDFCGEAAAFTDPLVLWREITARSLAHVRLHDVGLYWSWEPGAAEAHWGGSDGHPVWMLVAEVGYAEVDWPGTFWANLAAPDEKEIRLKSTARPRLLRLRDQKGDVVQTFDPPLRVKAMA